MQLPDRFRALILGYPKSGKSGALVALLKAGYQVIYCDFDGNPEVLRNAGEAQENLVYLPFEDKVRKIGNEGRLAGISGEARAYLNFMEFLETGKYVSPNGKDREDWGPMLSWGSDTVLVVDSMTRQIDAIWRRYLFSKGTTQKTKRDWGAIVDELSFAIDMIMSTRLACHTIVIAHLQLTGAEEMEEDPNNQRSETVKYNNELKAARAELLGPRLFPRAVTKAQSEVIAGKFPCILPAELNEKGERIFNLQPRKEIPVAVPALAKLPKTLPMDGGLLTIFQAVTGQTTPTPVAE
jgi:hypothetical protein